MDDPRSLRIVTVGLILAALAVGYFLLTGGFSVTKSKKTQSQNIQTADVTSSPAPSYEAVTPSPASQPQNATASAYSRILARNQAQGNVQTLPATGFPAGLAVIFSVGTIVSGWSLRKYPN